MDDEELYDKFCKNQFKSIKGMIGAMHNRLFVDNGRESLQSRINRIDAWVSKITKFTAAVGVVVLGLTIEHIWSVVSKLLNVIQ
jgi:hypothetical protein